MTRNPVWKNDLTLFTSDVKVQSKSAKLLNAAGGALITEYSVQKDSPEKVNKLNEAIDYLEQATKIHPGYRNAYLLLGNGHYYLKEYEKSIMYLDQALQMDPNFEDAKKNLPIILRDGGRFMGEKKNNFPKAEAWLLRSYDLNPKDYETSRLLGITFGIQGKNEKAVEYFQNAIALRPDIAANYSSLGTAYVNLGLEEKAREAFNKALSIDPNALKNMRK